MKIPAKTFFLGEYLALFGGPACLALTEKCFSLNFQKRLHSKSPAQKLWQAKTAQFCNWGLDDPYQAKGGLGASGAEFLFAYQQLFPGEVKLMHLYQTYKEYVKTGSGYDVLAQSGEGMVVLDGSNCQRQTQAWPFAEFGFILIHTGIKLKTHEHLHDLKELPWQRLIPAADLGCEALVDGNAEKFLGSIHDYARQLKALNLVAKHSEDEIQRWQQRWPILAAKGCGAMGSDVIVLFVETHKMADILAIARRENYDILATQADLYFKKTKKNLKNT